MSEREDSLARASALDTRRSIHLQAPAGSGKTTVLAQRFLAALAVADEPEEVLAITFTRKAAGEMRERVLAALEDRLPPHRPEPELWQQLRAGVHAQAARREWLPEELPLRLRIQTIDSLAAELARAMPVLGRLQTSLAVVEEATPLYAEAARRTLREADEDPECRADIALLMARLDNNLDQAARLLAELLPGRNRWQQLLGEHPPDTLAGELLASLERIACATLGRLQTVMPQHWVAEAAALASTAARNRLDAGRDDDGPWRLWLEEGTTPGDAPADLAAWQAVAALLLAKNEDRLLKSINVSSGFPPTARELKARWQDWRDELESRPEALRLLCELRALPPVRLPEEEARTIAALARILLLAGAQLKLVFRERGLVDHGEIAAIARQALRALDEESGFALRQTLRVSHLLVDECQDTSPDQIELVRALTSGWQRGDARSLFLVGDPMQSIYLFRGSEVGLFLQTRNQGVGALKLEALQLTRNFRSQQSLVGWANDAFARIFPDGENLRSSAVSFLPAVHARAPDTRLEAGVELWPQASDDAEAEARAIVAEIATLRSRDPGLSIAVLAQTRAVAAPVLRALHGASIATVGVDLAALSDRPVVRDLVALGQALLDAGDRRAWLAVLRSPPCGLLLADLLALREAAGDAPLVELLADPASVAAELSPDASARLRRAGPVLAAAWRARGSQDIASAIENCWRELGGEAACLDATELAASRQYLLALRRQQAQEGRLDGARLESLAAHLRDRDEASGENPVEVLTIHRAKGLEWDVVYVPGMGRMARRGDAPLLRWLQLPEASGSHDLLLAVRSIGEPASSDPLAAYIRRLQAERQRNERLRLLYVAVTRARLRLVLSGHAPSGPKDARPRPRSGSLLELAWPAIGQDWNAATSQAATTSAAAAVDAPLPMLWHRLPTDFQPAAPAGLPLPHTLTRVPALEDAAVEYSWVGPVARAAGTVMHAELERLSRHGEPAITGLASRLGECEARLREQGIAATEARRGAQRIIRRLTELTADADARWLLFVAHREAASEVALSGMVDGELRSVVIDRMFIDADGNRWIVDYKTGVHAGGSLEQFVERELARYTPQLRGYAQLARRLGPQPVRAALYFPWLASLRELPAAALT